jgi:hypothetical protein
MSSKNAFMDAAALRAAIDAGQEAAIFRELADCGISFDSRLGKVGFLKRPAAQVRLKLAADNSYTYDAQPELVTVNNAGIPAWLANYFDPTLIEVVLSPLKATEIVGSEVQKGDWTSAYATFAMVESAGEVSSYGDFNANGMTSANVNFPHRQSYVYQTFTQWGEMEAERMGLAKVDWANQQNQASMKVLSRFQNDTYFYGVSGLQNYGLLNDPNLYAPIAATSGWQASGTTPETIYEDVRRLFAKLQRQSDSVVDSETAMTLALSSYTDSALDKTNIYGLSARDQLKKHFPNLTVKTAPQYSTSSGELVQLIANSVNGMKTAETAFNVKMRAHAVLVGHSSWSQKKSQGSFGTIIYKPFAIAQLLGA